MYSWGCRELMGVETRGSKYQPMHTMPVLIPMEEEIVKVCASNTCAGAVTKRGEALIWVGYFSSKNSLILPPFQGRQEPRTSSTHFYSPNLVRPLREKFVIDSVAGDSFWIGKSHHKIPIYFLTCSSSRC